MNNAGRIGFLIKGEYDEAATYDFLDVVFYGGASYVAKKLTIGNPPVRNDEYWQVLAEGGSLTTDGDASDTIVVFDEAENRVSVNSGDKLSTIAGKIRKWFSDLSNGAAGTLLGKNLQEGKVLVSDAEGKVSASRITSDTLEYLSGLTGEVQEQLNDKIDVSKIIESTNITEKGLLMDGKIASDKFTEIGEAINRYNNYIPLTGNTGVLSDVLQVDNANKESILHKKYSITQSSSYGYLANMPDIISSTTSMIFRDVFYRSDGNILVKLLELYPVAGRVWYNGLIKSGSTGTVTWSGWRCNQPKDTLLLNTTKYGVSFRFWGNPNEAHYRINGTTNAEIPTSGKEVSIGILPEGYRPKISLIGYFLVGNLRCQIRFLTSGAVEIGFSASTSTGLAGNIPSGIGIYTFGSVSLQSGA